MQLRAWVSAGVGAVLLAAACGGGEFTTGNGDAGTSSGGSSGGSGGTSGSSSGGGSGSSSSGGGREGGAASSSSGGSGGGSGSTSGGGSSSGTSGDAGTPVDGGGSTDACTPSTRPTRCGSTTCNASNGQQGDICCIAPFSGMPYACAACECGCTTQLECATSGDCGMGEECCIQELPCGDGGNHWVATCQSVTQQCSGARLCNPQSGVNQCFAGSCSTNTSSFGIPSNSGYGVCM